LVDPFIQDGSYGPFAYANGLISEEVWGQMNLTYVQCARDIVELNYTQALEDCSEIMEQVLEAAGNINYYNIDLPCTYPPLCYDFTNITNYLNLESTQSQIGVDNITWQACNFQVNSDFVNDIEMSYAMDIPVLLGNEVNVFVYSGMLDLICNYFGGDMWTSRLLWEGQEGFNDQKFKNWSVNGEVAGYFKTYQNFTFLEVENAGHMVPHDQPSNALEILRWILSPSFNK